jgi:hypothetical protein
MTFTRSSSVIAALVALAMPCLPVRAEMSAEELAKMAQNPVGNLVSVPFQNNTNFNTGPLSGTQNILNIQPVVPINVNKDWNLITRTIMPLIWQPATLPAKATPSAWATSSSRPSCRRPSPVLGG